MIKEFKDENFFLSNFSFSPIEEDGITYPTVEHYFQAMKTKNLAERKKIADANGASAAKYLGRRVKLREDWEEIKDKVMYNALVLKFSKNPLKEKLLATKNEKLIEGNFWHDNYWGDCHCPECRNKKGKNILGKTLMKVRDELRKEKKNE